MRIVLLLALLGGCATTGPAPVPPPSAPPEPPSIAEAPDAAPREAVRAFAGAVAEGRLDAAFHLLSERWRARLTPERLGDDLADGGALARDRLERARLAAEGPATVDGDAAAFPVGEGAAVRLVREPTGWKLDTLE